MSMSTITKDIICYPVKGITDSLVTSGDEYGFRTVNFYSDDEGYVVNYPGKVDHYIRVGDLPSYKGTPPTLGVCSRVHTFLDKAQNEHTIFVKGNQLLEKVGNGYKILYTFSGLVYNAACWPTIFSHKDRVIIANQGDPVLVYSGIEDVIPLGVTEIPTPPRVIVHEDPFIRNGTGYGVLPNILNPQGLWSLHGLWPPGEVPDNNLGNQLDGSGNMIDGYYKFIVVYKDDDGNQSIASASSSVVHVNHDEGDGLTFAQAAEKPIKHWVLVEWDSPMLNTHVPSVEVYRTLNLHPLAGGLDGIYYRDWVQQDITCCRYTPRRSDGDISNDLLLDISLKPPPSSNLGCSWGPRIVLVSDDILYFSTENKFGQFKETYIPKDHVVAVLSIADRLLVVTHTTCEILYYDQNGLIHHLETYENKGSHFGRSFTVYKNISFGIFNDGFYSFDGNVFNKIQTPYYFNVEFIDRDSVIQKAVIVKNWYLFSCRKEFMGALNNSILMFNLVSNAWFVIEESVNDLCVFDDVVYGVQDSLYRLFTGAVFNESKLMINGFTENILREKTLSDIFIILDTLGKTEINLVVSSDVYTEQFAGIANTMPRIRKIDNNSAFYPYIGDNRTSFSNNVIRWVGPNETLLHTYLDNSIGGYKHSVELTFQSGLPLKIRAIVLRVSMESDDANKK